MADITGYRVKVVENAGDRIDRRLIKSDIKEGVNCETDECRLCVSKMITKKKGQPYNRRGLTYRCEGKNKA